MDVQVEGVGMEVEGELEVEERGFKDGAGRGSEWSIALGLGRRYSTTVSDVVAVDVVIADVDAVVVVVQVLWRG